MWFIRAVHLPDATRPVRETSCPVHEGGPEGVSLHFLPVGLLVAFIVHLAQDNRHRRRLRVTGGHEPDVSGRIVPTAVPGLQHIEIKHAVIG